MTNTWQNQGLHRTEPLESTQNNNKDGRELLEK